MIIRYKGQNENFEDLNTGMPSVFSISEMLLQLLRNLVETRCWYIDPLYTSMYTLSLLGPLKLNLSQMILYIPSPTHYMYVDKSN